VDQPVSACTPRENRRPPRGGRWPRAVLAALALWALACGCVVVEPQSTDASNEEDLYDAVPPPPEWPEEVKAAEPPPAEPVPPQPASAPSPSKIPPHAKAPEDRARVPKPKPAPPPKPAPKQMPVPSPPGEEKHRRESVAFTGPLPWRSWVRTTIYGRYRPLGSLFRSRRRNARGRIYYHQGVDILAPRGTPLVAPADGVVVRAGNWNPSGYGNALLMRVRAGSRVRYVLYAHLDRILVKRGQRFRRGRRVATAGTSGNARRLPAKEQHVHVEVRTRERVGGGLEGRVDPLRYFRDVVPPKELRQVRAR